MRNHHRLIVAAHVAALALSAASSARADLVSLYRFENNLNDATGAYNGTSVNSPGYSTGFNGSGFAGEFDGTDDVVALTTASNLGLSANFTVSAFIRPDVLTNDRTILGTDTGSQNVGLHLITRGTTAHLGFYGNDTPGIRTVPVTPAWTHVTWQFKDGVQAIYVNGSLDNQTGGHLAFGGGANTVNIGRWGNGNYFDGGIDNLAIYNNALSTNQIGFLAGGGNPQALPAAVASTAWDFRTAAGTAAAGWSTISGTALQRINDDGGGIAAGDPGGGFAHDNPHATLVYRSPLIQFNGGTHDNVNVLSVDFTGGAGDQDGGTSAFANPAAVVTFNGGASATNGEKGIAIRDITAGGNYVAYVFNPSDGASGFVNVSLAQFNSLGLNLSHTYQFDFYENDQGGWGWTQLRQVNFAGSVVVPEPTGLALFGLGGLALLRRRRKA